MKAETMEPVDQRSERRAKRFWISLVLMLFAIQFTIGSVAIHYATSNPSMVVIPDYHEAALNWDAHQHLHTAANRLGWKIGIDVSLLSGDHGHA